MNDRDPKSLQDEISRAEARVAELDEERDRVSRRISELKTELSSLQMAGDHRQPAQQAAKPGRPAPSTSAQKIAMFMELFRGRRDVYPKRWVNAKKGTKGYSPACSNEWVRGVCDKRSVKCGECRVVCPPEYDAVERVSPPDLAPIVERPAEPDKQN